MRGDGGGWRRVTGNLACAQLLIGDKPDDPLAGGIGESTKWRLDIGDIHLMGWLT